MSRSWEEIKDEFYKVCEMSCRPQNIRKVPSWYIFDANKSVNWNREQVEINNKKYREEINHLTEERNIEREKVLSHTYELIQEEVGHGLSREKARVIWDFACNNACIDGIPETLDYLSDLIDLIKDVREDK